MEKIKSDIQKVSRILQISDQHIRLFKRKDEYKTVFNNLFESMKKNVIENETLIISTGDLIHTKVESAPEMIDLMSKFLRGCESISPTILIPGNHDCSLNNLSRMDALSPVVNALDLKNLFYLKHSGLYKIGNLTLSHMSVFEKKDDYIFANDIPDDGTLKVAIFHGVIQNAQTNAGYKLTNATMNVDDFDGFDFVFLGDIHAHQILQLRSVEEKEIDEFEFNTYSKKNWKILYE